jgi:hypothetical protein
MADPLGVTASIIAAIQLSSVITKYTKDTHGGSDDRLRLWDEIRNTVCLLEMLKDRAEETDLRESWAKSLNSIGSPNGSLTQFSKTLELLVSKLTPKSRAGQMFQTLKWPLDKGEVVSPLDSLGRQKAMFNLALQSDHM